MKIDFEQGWSQWHVPLVASPSPYTHEKIEIARHEWDEPRTVTVRSIPPEMNMIGLYRRPVQDGGRS